MTNVYPGKDLRRRTFSHGAEIFDKPLIVKHICRHDVQEMGHKKNQSEKERNERRETAKNWDAPEAGARDEREYKHK
jgi:hypothetical protein